MKSLEIVNNTIVKQQTIEIKGTDRLPSIFVDDIRIAGVKWNDSPNVGYITAKLNIHSRVISMENLETIKQDLEVLEIIKNKKVEVLHLWYIIKTNEEKDNEYILMKYNEGFGNQMYKLTMEELLKLKQWLEDNENELGK